VLKAYWGHEFDFSGSRDVIGHVIIGFTIGHFLLVVLWNGVSISSRFLDICSKGIEVTSFTFQVT